MDRIRPGRPRGFDNPGNIQITFARGRRPDRISAVGRLDMQRVRIRFGKHRDRFYTQTTGGAGDAAGDLAPVGDQQGAEHVGHIRNTPKRVSCLGLFNAADKASPSTRRLSAGSMMPSSHNRALA